MLKKIVLISLMGLSVSAVAGPWQVKLGGSVVDPTDSTNVAGVGKVEATREGAITPSVEYFFNDNVSVEVLLAAPINHGVEVAGVKSLEIKQLPPVITAKYHLINSSPFTPYVGVGAVAFIPWDEDEKGLLTGTDVSVKESFGFAGQIGVNFKPADAKNWGVFLDARYAQVSPEVKVKGTDIKFDLDINPLVYTAGYSYRF
jgi:outer membrane protein